jgi:cell division ATPase FtsA
LIKNNDLKTIKQIFNKSNLNVKKILLKSFSEGVQLINENKNTETFFKIKMNKDSSNISFFYKSAFKYSENFKFGTNIILQDIAKICSLDNKIVKSFLSNNYFEKNIFEQNELLEEKYFTKGNYRKIRKKLILDIANARINEIASIILNKNINTKSFQLDNVKTYIIIKDELILNNFKENFRYCFSDNNNFQLNFINDFDINSSIINTANLSIYGWKKEAIPIVQTKSSLITRIFRSFFG